MIIKYFLRIPGSFLLKIPNFTPFMKLLMEIILECLTNKSESTNKNSIFTQCCRIFNTIMAMVHVKFEKEDYLILTKIVNKMGVTDFGWGVKFISSFFTHYNQKVDFEKLREYSTKFKVDQITYIESILMKSNGFYENLVQVLINNIEIFSGFLRCKEPKVFMKYVEFCHKEGKFKSAGLTIPRVETISQNNQWFKFKRVFLKYNLEKYFKMLDEYCLESSIINESFMILNSLLVNAKRIYLKKFLHEKEFFKKFMNPFANFIFHPEVENMIVHYYVIQP